MSRTIKLQDWAKEEFDEPIPSMPSLLKYVKNGMIYPQPFKVGGAGVSTEQRDLSEFPFNQLSKRMTMSA